MSNKVDRYRQMYNRIVRPNSAHTFPAHQFLRSANIRTHENDRIGDR
jgi:hypothetical protein